MNQEDRDHFGGLLVSLSLVAIGYVLLTWLRPDVLNSYIVPLSAVGIAVSSVGFSAFFAVRNNAVTTSRIYDAQIIAFAVGLTSDRDRNLSQDVPKIRFALRLSSYYRELAKSRAYSMAFLLYAALAFGLAILFAVVFASQPGWISCFGGGLLLSVAAVLINYLSLGYAISERFPQPPGPAGWTGLPNRWVLTDDAIGRIDGLEELAKVLEKSSKLPPSVDQM